MAKTTGKKRRRSLTRRERAFLKARLSGKTLKDSALVAGYSPKGAANAGFQAANRITAKTPDVWGELGLDDRSFIQKYVLPALNATEVKVVQNTRRGKNQPPFIYSRKLVAWGPRTVTNRLVAEMKGMVKGEQENQAPGVKVLIINAENRPPRKAQVAAPPAIDLPNQERTT